MKLYFFSSLILQTIVFIFLALHFEEILNASKKTFTNWTTPQEATTTKISLQTTIDSQTKNDFTETNLASDLLSIQELNATSKKNYTGNGNINLEKNDASTIKAFFPGEDNHLQIVDISDKNFLNSKLREQLKKISSLRVYVIVKFKKTITPRILSSMKKAGFSAIANLPKNNYINKKYGVFYIRFRNIRSASKYGNDVANIYLIKNYTAVGIYQLEIKSMADKQNLLLQVSVPYSELGHQLVQERNTLLSEKNELLQTTSVNNTEQIKLDVKKNESLSMFSEVKYHIDLQKNVSKHIYVQGDKMTLSEYANEMTEKNLAIHQQFTQFSEKIVPSKYIDSIVAQIDTSRSLAEVWKQIDIILDKDIRYDWKKRDLFFSGNLTYENIKDMYMTAEELGIKKKGACPERTSLEIAILRKMGIAARSATRLYHIYTEIYIPNFGWTTTSLTLNEISLIKSDDKNMAYFVSWSPNHPIRLKWEGQLYPNIVF